MYTNLVGKNHQKVTENLYEVKEQANRVPENFTNKKINKHLQIFG